MKYFLLLVLCSIRSLNTAEVLTNSVEDYYWRDYKGLVPKDAIAGGTTQDGQITYIGQMSVPKDVRLPNNYTIEIIPAIITPGNKTVIGSFVGHSITNKKDSNVKVLCTQNPSRYSWHNQSSLVESGCSYVEVGLGYLIPLYVGKVEFMGQILIGQVLSDEKTYVYVPYKGGQLALNNFTTLMYCV